MRAVLSASLLTAGAFALCGGLARAAEPMVMPDELLRDAGFRPAYAAALGARAKTPWLAKLDNSAPVRTVTVGGVAYRVATPCKPHDCADNNMLVMYAPSTQAVVGKLFEKGRATLVGSPDATLAAEIERLWRKEFRQQ